VDGDRVTCRVPCLPDEGEMCLGCAAAYHMPEEPRDTVLDADLGARRTMELVDGALVSLGEAR
jgi:hypothetical protein